MIKDDNYKKISDVARKVATTLSHIFTGVGILVDIIFLFVPSGPSEMHLEMRKSFQEVNRKLDDIQYQITQLNNHIDWKFKKSKFDEYANEIDTLVEKSISCLAMSQEFRLLKVKRKMSSGTVMGFTVMSLSIF